MNENQKKKLEIVVVVVVLGLSFLPKLCLEREQRVSVCPKRKHDDQHDRYGRCCHSLFDSTQKEGGNEGSKENYTVKRTEKRKGIGFRD
jgi:hypothetical protein